jgi:uncharacterized small protein (DUF1192 family)
MLENMTRPIVNGFRLLASETKWTCIKGFRRWEIRQMEKRLAEEYLNLGKSFAASQASGEAFDPQSSDNDLTLKQISFLQEEIAHLRAELEATRAEFVKGRTDTNASEA